jgi:hypothetical protein
LVKEIFGDPRNFGGSDPVNMLLVFQNHNIPATENFIQLIL